MSELTGIVGQRNRFRDFQNQILWMQLAAPELFDQHRDKIRRKQLAAGNIDHQRLLQSLCAPLRELRQPLPDDTTGKLLDLACLFRQRNKDVRTNPSTVAIRPAGQRLKTLAFTLFKPIAFASFATP